jgi:hypothetical protein
MRPFFVDLDQGNLFYGTKETNLKYLVHGFTLELQQMVSTDSIVWGRDMQSGMPILQLEPQPPA